MISFIAGQTYSARSVIDPDEVMTFTVTARTPKKVFVREGDGPESMHHAFVLDGVEWCYPLGTYQDAPKIWANKPADMKELTDD
jgi:hypothetical protein